jgi:hypothetical protein
MPATRDRAHVIHFAGRHRLSPALHDGVPSLVAHGEQGERCGWEPFFRAMDERALALDADPDGGTFRLVPAARARHRRTTPLAALSRARRFLAALRGRAGG